MFVKKAVLISAMLVIPSFVFAQGSSSNGASANTATVSTSDAKPGSGPNPFTDCGIGAALFPNTHWAAITSNVIWDIGLTALTSATASPQTCSGKRLHAAVFINDTYEQLAEETARGEGVHLTTVLNILECDGARRAPAIEAARSAMGELIAQPGYASQKRIEKAAQYYGVVETAVNKSCSA